MNENKKRILTGLLAAALVVPLFAGGAQTAAAAEEAGKTLDVVFTHEYPLPSEQFFHGD